MTNGIKEKDIRDMQKCFNKMEVILKRIRQYNSEAKIICMDSDAIGLVNFNGAIVDSLPGIKEEHIVAEKWIPGLDNYC